VAARFPISLDGENQPGSTINADQAAVNEAARTVHGRHYGRNAVLTRDDRRM
jgi:hypothetical protein